MTYQFQHQLQYSPTLLRSIHFSSPDKTYHRQPSSITSIHSDTQNTFPVNHSTINGHYGSQQRKDSTLTPISFIRIHIPNEHIVIVSSTFL